MIISRLGQFIGLMMAAALVLSGCRSHEEVASAPTSSPAAGQLHQLFEDYREANFHLNPIEAMYQGDMRFNHRLGEGLSDDYIARSLALESETLEQLAAIDRSRLNEQDQLSYDFFRYLREVQREYFAEGFARKEALLPVSQFFSLPNYMAVLGSGAATQPFASVQDYDNWLSRMGEYSDWTQIAIARMQEGVKEGVVQSRVLIERTLPQLRAHLVENVEQSIFYKPIQNMPDSFSVADKQRLEKAYRKAISERFVPTYRQLHDYLQNEYLPNTRETFGLGQLPGGSALYNFKVRQRTTTSLTPAEIHEIGLAETQKLLREMAAVKETVGFKGDMAAFFEFLRSDSQFHYPSEAALVKAYEDVKAQVDRGLPQLFDVQPKAPYIVKPIEQFRAASSAAAEYRAPAPDGSKPGVFYINTYDLQARPTYMREAISIHEAAPGHHFQIALAQEMEGLPAFRRFNHVTAYVEGWGLYTETLGKDLGLYQDPYQYFGYLTAAMWRACRLVVDTGLHAKGWSRQQAIDFMKAHTALADTDIVAEVERYMAIPGQALAYKIGKLKLLELRQRAESALGEAYDIRDYHREVLTDGALPLGILEAKVDRWIAETKSAEL